MGDSDGGARLVRKELLTGGAASNLAFNEEVKALQAAGRTVYHFGFGQSPFPVPQCMVQALRQHAHRSEYLSIKGLPSLRAGIAQYHLRQDGLRLDEESIVVGPGSKQLIYLILAVSRGVVVVPAPAWTTYAPQVRLAGLTLEVPPTAPGLVGGYKITPQTLEDTATRHRGQNIVLIHTNPGNPTGTCYTDEELQELAAVCRRHAIIVLSDEIYGHLSFSGRHCSMVKHYPEGSVLLSGFSKWAAAGGWRLGYAHFPAELWQLRDAVTAAASQTYSCAPAPMQYAVAQVLKENVDELEKYSRDCTSILHAVGDYCYRELREAGVAGTRSEGGFYFMPDFAPLKGRLAQRGITTGQQMTADMLVRANVALMPSSHFLLPEHDLSTRFCFICFDGDRALRALREQQGTMSGRGVANGKEQDNNGEHGITEDFVKEYCKPVVEGVEALKQWTRL